MRRSRVILGLIVSVGALLSVSANATDATGVVVDYHLNPAVTNRIACVSLSPGVGGTGSVCLYNTNSLYKEINTLLLAAYASQRECTLSWNSLDASNHKILSHITCR